MSKRLFVANIPFTATEQALAALFDSYNFRVTEVRIIIDRDTQKSRGYGFVEMETEEDARDAIAEMNEAAEIEGRRLAVRIADPRPESRGGKNSPRSTRDW